MIGLFSSVSHQPHHRGIARECSKRQSVPVPDDATPVSTLLCRLSAHPPDGVAFPFRCCALVGTPICTPIAFGQGNTPKLCYEARLHRMSPLCSGKQRADPPSHLRIFIVEIVHDNGHDSVCAYVQSQGRTSTFLFTVTTSTSRPQRESTYKRSLLNHVRYCAK